MDFLLDMDEDWGIEELAASLTTQMASAFSNFCHGFGWVVFSLSCCAFSVMCILLVRVDHDIRGYILTVLSILWSILWVCVAIVELLYFFGFLILAVLVAVIWPVCS